MASPEEPTDGSSLGNVRNQHERSDTPILVNGSNVVMTPAAANKAKEAAVALKTVPDHRVAFVGLTRLQRSTTQLLMKSQHLEADSCGTLEEGQEWLVKQV